MRIAENETVDRISVGGWATVEAEIERGVLAGPEAAGSGDLGAGSGVGEEDAGVAGIDLDDCGVVDMGCVTRYAEAYDGGADSVLASDERRLGGLDRGGHCGRAEEGNGPEKYRELHFVCVFLVR